MCLLLAVRSRISWVMVIGQSMQPGLRAGDLLLVDRWAYHKTDPQRGDVVLFPYQNELVVKRVVGLPGEEVELKSGTLYINGLTLNESYPTGTGNLNVEKGRLLGGKFATLGDNRSVSPLLAVHPIVTKKEIIGRAILSIRLPWSRTPPANHSPFRFY
jgi:signal peptidase I